MDCHCRIVTLVVLLLFTGPRMSDEQGKQENVIIVLFFLTLKFQSVLLVS